MAKARQSMSASAGVQADYMVLSVTEIDRLVYETLAKQGAAKAHPDDPASYIVTDVEKARSQAIMPKVLAKFGRKGWELVAVNKMECFIFRRRPNQEAVEYMVQAPSDLDKLSLKVLEQRGQLTVEKEENEIPTVQIKDARQARIQEILPKLLQQFSDEGWQLAAISGPQLYFFTRPARR